MAEHVVATLVGVVGDALFPVRQIQEEVDMHLEHHEVSPEKDAGDEWVAHPLLLHNYFTCLHFPLDKYPLVGCQGAVAEYPHLLDPRLTRITSYTFSAFSLS